MKTRETHVLVIYAKGVYITYADDNKETLQGFADTLWKGFPYSLTKINLTIKQDGVTQPDNIEKSPTER